MEASGVGTRPVGVGDEGGGNDQGRGWLDFTLIALGLLGVAMLLAASFEFVFPGIDARFALAWGSELADGYNTDFDGAVPAKHPLTLAIGALFSLAGPTGARAAYGALSLLSYMFLIYAVFRLGRTSAGRAAGLLAAVLAAIQPELLIQGATSGKDIPFAALCLLAASYALEGAERHWIRVMVLLAVAGLIRPEAWLLAALYGGWLLWLWSTRAPRLAVLGLVLISPVIWTAADVAFTGNPIHTLEHARDKKAIKAEEGLIDGDVQESSSGPLRKYVKALDGGIPGTIGWPMTIAALLVGLWTIATRREAPPSRRAPPAGEPRFATTEHPLVILVAVVLASLLFGVVLVAIGLPFVDRFLLLPSLILIVIAATSLSRIGERGIFAIALPLTIIGAAIGAPGNFDEVEAALDESAITARDAAVINRLASQPLVTEALEDCPQVVFGGSGRRGKIQLGRTIVGPELGIGLDQIPAELPVLLKGPGQSAFAHGFSPRSPQIYDSGEVGAFPPTSVRDGRWLFASLCKTGQTESASGS